MSNYEVFPQDGPLTNPSGTGTGRIDSPVFDHNGKDIKGYPLLVVVDPAIVSEVTTGYFDQTSEGQV